MSEEEKAEEQRHKAEEQRRAVIEASDPLELRCTSPELTLQVRKAHTVLEVLQMVAKTQGLPEAAAASWLQMEFAGPILEHASTVQAVGMCDHAEFSTQGMEEALAKMAEADKVDVWDATKDGKVDEVRLVLSVYPEKASAKNEVRDLSPHHC